MKRLSPRMIGAAALTLAITPAWADATETVDPKSAVEFVLSICLPAMDDLSSVERLAQENKWFRLPTNPSSDSKYTTAHLRWRANGYFVTTWSFKGGTFLVASSESVPSKGSIGTDFSR
jgi:hypothetical protein